MSDILYRWLNQGLRLSKTVNAESCAKDFSSGYLIGEILHRYQLQDDFSQFIKKDTAISKVNNFRRLEPSLKLLGISFDMKTAQDLMEEKEGVAMHVLHQLYDLLKKKKNAEINRTTMEIKQPQDKTCLHKKEHEIYSFRLPQVVKPDAELKLQKSSQRYDETCQKLTIRSVMAQPIQQTIQLKIQDEKGKRKSEKKQQDMTCNQATKVRVPEPFSSSSSVNKERRQLQRKEQEGRRVYAEITKFETNQKKLLTSGFGSSSRGQPLLTDFPPVGTKRGCKVPGGGTEVLVQSNDKYIQEIRQRKKEEADLSERRQKRQDRFLVEQLKARQAEQDALQNELLVKSLTRQSRAEQRLVAQLLQIRKVKEVIIENRRYREQQYQERRERDFQEALHRELVLAQEAKLAREMEIREEIEYQERIAAEIAQSKWKKNVESCKGILEQIVDLATNVGEYKSDRGVREESRSPPPDSSCPTGSPSKRQIPGKMMRYWKELLFIGLPLYEPTKTHEESSKSSPSQDPTELKKQEILNNLDYEEYTKMAGEWAWPEEAGETTLPPPYKDILGQRLRELVPPSVVEPSTALFPCSTIKACVLGKFCSANKECLAKIGKALGIYVLSMDAVIEEALKAYKNGEKIFQIISKRKVETMKKLIQLTIRARQGAAVDMEMRKGNTIPNQLLVEMMVEAISQVPAQSSWILDGFPYDIAQAQLLEKALGGSVDEENEVVSERANPPPPAPVLDLAVLLDIPNECVIRHAYSFIDTEAAATLQPNDKTLYLAQVSHRIEVFQCTWPDLKEWFGEKQNILVHVDAEVEHEKLYNTLESLFQQAMHKKREEHASLASESKDDVHGVPKNQHKLVSSGVAPSSQDYVDNPLPPEIPQHLCSYWDDVWDSYVNDIKKVMQQLRSKRSAIDRQLFSIRERYKQYLARPDIKQELLSQWQEVFNSTPDDRDCEEIKAELHLRLDELHERLWDITNKRKEENEQERAELMCNDWLDEHTFLLIKHHSILTQVELSRFEETSAILRIYYLGMQRQVPLEPLPKFTCNPLLETPGIEAQDERSHSSKSSKNEKNEEPEKPSHEQLLTDCEAALEAISKLLISQNVMQVSAEAHQPEIKENEESLHEKAKQDDDDGSVKIEYQEGRETFFQEYPAALNNEENRATVHIELVKRHGLEMVHSLQRRAQDISDKMENWLQAQYLAEMKCIDQLSEVARHHIEAGATLQYELVLEGSDFFINEDHLLVESPAPPLRPAPLETPVGSTPTIVQLESLRHQLWSAAPSGVMSSTAFFGLLKELVSVNTGRNTVPKPWMGNTEAKWVAIVSLLTDDYELIDWQRFLLSAALPWPFPSLTQLLVVLGRFKVADVASTGYINEEQYLKTELWFSSDTIQTVSEDPSEPLPFDRLANLRKFFFQLFADHSFSPPQLDYVSMLQYFAADPDPGHGFIRALSVVLGQDLQQPSMDHAVKSLPSIEEATELVSLEIKSAYKEDETPYPSSSHFREQEVSISSLLNVFCHKAVKMRGKHRLPPSCLSKEEHTENLTRVYGELGYDSEDCVPFSVLSKHPYTQILMETSTRYQLVDIHQVLQGD
ncbi:sperm flagellar protein 2 [Cololabis saira]|uniref:sperm flagellar protein 2 n=1 Tax=Cololabis saira TaxID=129043 RepID=UPI002AD54745|nr:sperm flagellar protein 2 [Cololabis saira]